MTINAVVFVLLILGVCSTVAEVLFRKFFQFMFGILAFLIWVVSIIIVAPDFPYMIIVYLVLMVVNMLIAFVNINK